LKSHTLVSLTSCPAAVFMAVDMLGRLNAVMEERKVVLGKKTQ